MKISANICLVLLWFWLYRPVYPYLETIFTRQEFRTNQILLLAVVVLLVMQIRRGELRPKLDSQPQLYLPALALALGGSLLFLLVERWLDVNTLSATLFGLASYGLLGLWLQPERWRRGLPAALLLVGVLPFGEHMQTFIGYPMRILTADLVRDGLAYLGVHTVGIDTILVFENGISQVDIPCSGIKSLWTGGLFLLAATWIDRRRMDLRWLLVALIFVLMLFIANLARVGILVSVGQVAGWRFFAEMLHVPLGVIGFGATCAAALSLLRFSHRQSPGLATTAIEEDDLRMASPPYRPNWLAPLLLATFLVMVLLYNPRTEPALAAPVITAWNFPDDLAVEPWPLNDQELDWVADVGAQSVDRWRFRWRGLSGSMLFVTSDTWRAQHRPERCFQVYGLTVENSYTHLIAPGFPLRLVSLSQGGRGATSSAVYWFQSVESTTDDYGARMWADLAVQRQNWVQVTVLFDGLVDPRSTASQDLYLVLHQVVQRNLAGGSVP